MINRLSPLAYRLATSLLTPFLPLWLARRARAGKEDAARLGERFGKTDRARPLGQLIWIHGASIGETQMVRPLIDALLKSPNRHVLITSGTMTSAQLLAEQLPPRAIHHYVPLDAPRAAARFMAHWQPDLAVFVESEIWPNLIWTAERADIPLALINARMSAASLRRWSKRAQLARSVFGAFNTILAADERTAAGLSKLSIGTVVNHGSLKDDAPALSFDVSEAARLRALIGDRPVWLAASTHAAEEHVIAELHAENPDAFLIWLPRHPERGAVIAERMGAPRRSQDQDPNPEQANVYVMDTLGEMGLALSLSDVCVMGGSLDPSLMGHNPLEPARAGVPVISGPHVESFAELYARMESAGAARIGTPAELLDLIRQGLHGELKTQATRADAFAKSQSGALAATLRALEDLL